MVVSFHPCFVAECNIVCAGRQPDQRDRAAIQAARAVILPQGCPEALYRMARDSGRPVFPNYAARFDYPGKCGQIRLFRRCGVPHPPTELLAPGSPVDRVIARAERLGYPLVFKLDWGGEGRQVWRVATRSQLVQRLAWVRRRPSLAADECLLQAFIPNARRSLRVVVIGSYRRVYWRVQSDPRRFGTSLADGARIDPRVPAAVRWGALTAVERLCRSAGIDLAGIDLLVDERRADSAPLLLEVNHFFGRRGLGGSQAYYRILEAQIRSWLDRHPAARWTPDSRPSLPQPANRALKRASI